MSKLKFADQSTQGHSEEWANPDFHALLGYVEARQGKVQVSDSSIVKINADNADRQAGISHIHVSLVDAVKEGESKFWDKDAYTAQVQNVRAGLRAVMLSAVLSDHPIEGRNVNAINNAVKAHEHLLMDYDGLRFVRKGCDMAKMIEGELALAHVIAEQSTHAGYPDHLKAAAVKKLCDVQPQSKSESSLAIAL
jgi:hypothetical protein